MRNFLRRLGLLRSDRRPPARGRVYPPMMTTMRRYDVQRPEPRRPRRAVPWRRIGTFLLASAGTAAVLAGAIWLFRSDTLRVHVIDVQGAQVADPQTIADTSGVGGVSMLTLDLAQAGREIAKLPAVKAATVARDWPNGVRIQVTEHQAWGYWQAGPQRLVIDGDGFVLEQSRPPAADAPTIVEVGSAAPDAKSVSADPDTVQLVHRLRTDGTFDRLNVQPTSYVFRRDRGLTVIVASGPAAVLGDSSNYDFKVRTWQALLEQVRAGQVPQITASAQPSAATRQGQPSAVASEIDLRFGRNVVLR